MKKLRTVSIVLVVCLASSTPALAGKILHVPSQFTTIQAAVDAAHDGDAIHIASGTYAEAVTVEAFTHLELRGSGQVIIDATGLDSGIALSSCNNIRVHNLTIKNATSQGIRIRDSNVVTVDHCDIEGLGVSGSDDGIRIEDSDESTVASNTINNVGAVGVDLVAVGNGDTNSVIQKNEILSPHVGGIGITGSTNAAIANKIGSAGSFGIEVAADADNTTLRHNQIEVSVGDGILVAGPHCLVDRNTVGTPSGDAIFIFTTGVSATLEKNFIDRAAIVITADSCVSHGNRLRDAHGGGFVIGGSGGTYSNDNVDGTDDAAFGIGGTNNTLDHCKANKQSHIGFEISAIANGNIFKDCSVAHSDSDAFAVNGDDNTFTNCHTTGSGTGFDVRGTGNAFTGCKASKSAGFDLSDAAEDATTNTYLGCRFPVSNVTLP